MTVTAEEVMAELAADPPAQLVDMLIATLDELDTRPTPTLAGSALWYAGRGLAVFPLQPGSKQPFGKSHGCKDATTDLDRIRSWWERCPTANVGIATGHLVDVVDVDGTAGNVSLARRLLDDDVSAEAPFHPLEVVGVVSTPRPGGRHLYVPAVDGRGNKARLLPGVDYRGAGGYVVAPPSVNDQGSYEWSRPLDVEALS